MNNRKAGVLVSGRGSNLQAVLDRIADGYLPLEIGVVISDKADAYALERAANVGIKTVVVARKECASKEEFEDRIHAALVEAGCELVILAGFMRILGGGFVNRWPNKIINIHPALLPSFPGLDGQGQALEYGVKFAGCTVHFVDEGVDTGDIIIQRKVEVLEGDTPDDLAARVLKVEHQILTEAINKVIADF